MILLPVLQLKSERRLCFTPTASFLLKARQISVSDWLKGYEWGVVMLATLRHDQEGSWRKTGAFNGCTSQPMKLADCYIQQFRLGLEGIVLVGKEPPHLP